MLNVHPVEFECTDDAGELIFKVTAFDEQCASVEIKSVITPASWPEISAAIQNCLEAMKLKSGKETK